MAGRSARFSSGLSRASPFCRRCRGAFAGSQGARGETAPAEHLHDFFERRRRQVGAVVAGAQLAQRLAQVAELLPGLFEAPGEGFVVPALAGVVGLHRLAVAVEQAPVEVEAAAGMPAEGAPGVGEATEQRSGGIDADQVEVARLAFEAGQQRAAVGRCAEVLVLSLPGRGVEQQIGIGGNPGQALAQLPKAFGQTLAVFFRRAGERQVEARLAFVADQPEQRAGLAHPTGLAHPRPVEADELGVLGAVPEGEVLALGQVSAQVLGEGFEMLSLVHQASPPNTSTSLNTQAGEAWPTRITWFGSPLPQ